MNRCTILVVYDPQGIVDQCVYDLLAELQIVSKDIYVVANGKIREQDVQYFKEQGVNLIIRDNIGFDGGAYQDVIVNYMGKDHFICYDEVVLCNTTFLGPFIPLEVIFSQMDLKKCDFWGIDCNDREPFFSFLGGYFLVFKNNIIHNGDLYQFFLELEEIHNHLDAVVHYELGIYRYCIDKGYKSETYLDEIKYNLYRYPNYAMLEQGYPILKKRIFCERYYNQDVAFHALQLVYEYNEKYFYDALDSINRLYDMKLNSQEVLSYESESAKMPPCIRKFSTTDITKESLYEFLAKVKEVYVYGVGAYGIGVMYSQGFLLGCKKYNVKIQGFLVSQGYRREEKYKEYLIYEVNEIKNENNIGIIVGLDYEHAIEVKQYLKKYNHVLSMWKDNKDERKNSECNCTSIQHTKVY